MRSSLRKKSKVGQAVKFTNATFEENKHNTEAFKLTMKQSIADAYGVPDDYVYVLDITKEALW